MLSTNAGICSAEKSIMEHLLKMIANTEIPGPKDPTSPLYKLLVRKIRRKFRTSDSILDYLDVEVKARRLARWVEQLAMKAAAKSLSNIQARKMITPTNEDIAIEQLISDDEAQESILVEKLAKNSDSSSLPGRTGQSVTLLGKSGKKITVEGLLSDRKKKTLVTKESSDGEVGSWIVEVADKEQLKSIETLNSLGFSQQRKKTDPERKPRNADEWKTFADLKQMEVKEWKKRVESIGDKTSKQQKVQTADVTLRLRSQMNPSSPQKNMIKNTSPNKTRRKSVSPSKNKSNAMNHPINVNVQKASITQGTPRAKNSAFKVRQLTSRDHNPHSEISSLLNVNNEKNIFKSAKYRTNTDGKETGESMRANLSRSRNTVQQLQTNHQDFTPNFMTM